MLLTRALFETDFVLGALAKKVVTPEELVASDLGSRKKIGNAQLPVVKKESPPEHHAKLVAFITENAEAKPLALEDMARRAGMQLIYDGLYRYLSHFAAHPSVTAASEYFVELPDSRGRVAFRPLTRKTLINVLESLSPFAIVSKPLLVQSIEFRAKLLKRWIGDDLFEKSIYISQRNEVEVHVNQYIFKRRFYDDRITAHHWPIPDSIYL